MAGPKKVDIIGHLLLVLLIAAFAALTTRNVIHPFLEARENVGDFREAVGILSEADGSLDRLDAEIREVAANIAASEASLPRDLNLDAFLEQLGDLAEGTGVRVEQLLPSQMKVHRLFRELVLDVDVSGPFPAINEFLASVEHGDHLSRVSQLTVVGGRGRDLCTAHLRLALYFALEEEV
jgi:Tfp pilus assembly protein PilO